MAKDHLPSTVVKFPRDILASFVRNTLRMSWKCWRGERAPSKGFYLPSGFVELHSPQVALKEYTDLRGLLLLSQVSNVGKGFVVQEGNILKTNGDQVTPASPLPL